MVLGLSEAGGVISTDTGRLSAWSNTTEEYHHIQWCLRGLFGIRIRIQGKKKESGSVLDRWHSALLLMQH